MTLLVVLTFDGLRTSNNSESVINIKGEPEISANLEIEVTLRILALIIFIQDKLVEIQG